MKAENILNRREKIFAQLFFQDENWDSQPRTFVFSDGTKYTPDFYDANRDVYIEVVGTRQAFHNNKHKYAKMAEEYEDIEFECRKYTGDLYLSIPKNKFSSCSRNAGVETYRWWENMPPIEIELQESSAEAIRIVAYLRAWSISRLATEMGLKNGSHLSQVLNLKQPGSQELTERVLALMPEKYRKHMEPNP